MDFIPFMVSEEEFSVFHEAIQQYVDNHDELDPGEEVPPRLKTARALLERLDAKHAALYGG